MREKGNYEMCERESEKERRLMWNSERAVILRWHVLGES